MQHYSHIFPVVPFITGLLPFNPIVVRFNHYPSYEGLNRIRTKTINITVESIQLFSF